MMAIMACGSRTAALGRVTVPDAGDSRRRRRLDRPEWRTANRGGDPGARFVLVEGMGHDYPPQYWDQLVDLVSGHARQVAV